MNCMNGSGVYHVDCKVNLACNGCYCKIAPLLCTYCALNPPETDSPCLTTSQPCDLCPTCDSTVVNIYMRHAIAGHHWHNLNEQHMEEVALHKNTWTGFVAPCQVVSSLLHDMCCCSLTSHVALMCSLSVTIDKQATPLSAYVVALVVSVFWGLQVQEAVKLGQQLVHEGRCPWAIVSAWGFKGQPISWIGASPNSASSIDGENDYSIVILPDGQYMLLIASGSGDSFQTV